MWGHYAFCLKTIEIELALVPILGSKIFFKIGTNMQCLFGNNFYPSITKISPKPMLPLLEKRGRRLLPFSMIFFWNPPPLKWPSPNILEMKPPPKKWFKEKMQVLENVIIGICFLIVKQHWEITVFIVDERGYLSQQQYNIFQPTCYGTSILPLYINLINQIDWIN